MENKVNIAFIGVLSLVMGWAGITLNDFGERIRSNTQAISDLKVDVVESVDELDKTLSVFIATANAINQNVSFTHDPTKNYVRFKAEQSKNN